MLFLAKYHITKASSETWLIIMADQFFDWNHDPGRRFETCCAYQ
jgi:hypothetical protein